MIQTFVIYIILWSIMAFFCIPLYSQQKLSEAIATKTYSSLLVGNKVFSILIPIFLLSIICGFRYGIGEDFFSYQEIYNNLPTNNLLTTLKQSREEPLFVTLMFFLKKLNASYSILLFATSLISYFFLYKALRKYLLFLFPLAGFFLFTTGTFFIFMSYIRQMIAFFIFLYAIQFIIERKFIKYCFWITICVFFHYSAVILYPCYLLTYIKKEWITNTFILQFLISAITIIYGEQITNFLLESSLQLISNSMYGGYASRITSLTMDIGRGTALLLIMISDLLIISISKTLLKHYSDKHIQIYYLLFLIGSCLEHMFYKNILLSRIPVFWVNIRFIIIAFAIHYFFKYWKNNNLYFKIVCIYTIIIYTAYFCSIILNGAMNSSPFIFST